VWKKENIGLFLFSHPPLPWSLGCWTGRVGVRGERVRNAKQATLDPI